MGTFFVDPGRYSAFHCKDFAPALAAQTTRERDLRNLMDRASEGGGGAVIGNLSYRADYEKVLAEETELRRAAAEKNCDLGAPANTMPTAPPPSPSTPRLRCSAACRSAAQLSKRSDNSLIPRR